jgi:hypothetical protein
MRPIAPVLMALILAGSLPAPPARAQSCSDDYVTIETVEGTILEINPAPEPFKTADILFAGPSRCERIWMQVLKGDAARCRIGGRIQATGVITMDTEANAWDIGPTKNEYMALGEDFTCGS